MRKKKTTTRMTKMMTLSFIQSTKFQIALILVSWLRLHFLSKLIPQTLINVLLTVTFRLENLSFRTVSTIPVAYCIPMLVTFYILHFLLFTFIFLLLPSSAQAQAGLSWLYYQLNPTTHPPRKV